MAASELDESRGGPPHDATEALFAKAAMRGERILAVSRSAFCALILLRFFVIDVVHQPDGVRRACLELPALPLAIAFSAWVLSRGPDRVLGPRMLVASVSLDAVVCFVSLVSNVLWPWPAYDGILRIADSAAVLVVVFAGGLRLSARVAALGGALNALGAGVLVWLDLSLNGSRLEYGASEIALGAIYLAGCTALAILVAFRTHGLVADAAAQAVRAELARRSLHLVLEDHHDVRSLLSSASLNAELVLRGLRRSGGAPRELYGVAAQLRDDLESVGSSIAHVRDGAYAELAGLERLDRVPLGACMRDAAQALGRRFPGASISVDDRSGDAVVVVAGGRRGLERVLLNLVANAHEGDGERRGAHVAIEAACEDGDHAVLRVSDDGPGFPAAILESGTHERLSSSKPGGSGLGLLLVATIVRTSGGSLALANRAAGGAEITLRFPLARVARPSGSGRGAWLARG